MNKTFSQSLIAVFLTLGMTATVTAEDCDFSAGERQFRKCAVCHVIEDGALSTVGPNLHGVTGRPVAALDDFPYSSALTKKGGQWSVDQLDMFLRAPREFVPGTTMAFGGLKSSKARRNVICYLANH